MKTKTRIPQRLIDLTYDKLNNISLNDRRSGRTNNNNNCMFRIRYSSNIELRVDLQEDN